MISDTMRSQSSELSSLFETLLACQQELLQKANKLYSTNEHAWSYYKTLVDSHPSLPRDQLAMQVASFIFNSNILTGKTSWLISHTVYYNDNGIHLYCYRLRSSPWLFAVHATIYNLPLILLDIRKDYTSFSEEIMGFTVSLRAISLRLRLLVFGNLLDISHEPQPLYAQYGMRVLVKFQRIRYRVKNLIRLLRFRFTNDASYAGGLASSGLSLDYSLLPKTVMRTNALTRLLIITENIENMGHYFWNDALGIITYSNYLAIPKHSELVKGSHGYAGVLQLCSIAIDTVTAPSDCFECGFHVSIPAIALRTYPVEESSIQLLSKILMPDELSFSEIPTNALDKDCTQGLEILSPHFQQVDFIVIVFTLRLGNRPWANSKETILFLADYLQRHSKCIFVVDGMTKHERMSDREQQVLSEELLLGQEIVIALRERQIDAHSIVGCSFKQKLKLYKNVSIFIQPLGSGNIVPSWLLHKPVIAFGSRLLIDLLESFHQYYFSTQPYVLTLCTDEMNDDVECHVNCDRILDAMKADPTILGILKQSRSDNI
jgi:hypothetical protein